MYFILPDWPLTFKMLSPDQSMLAHVRMLHQRDEPWKAEGEAALTPLQALVAVLQDEKMYFFLALYASNYLALNIL